MRQGQNQGVGNDASVAADGDTSRSPAALPALSARQQMLAATLHCHYATDTTTDQRPECQGVAVVAYGPIVLCAMCNKMRSAVGRTHPPRSVPGAELSQLIDAAVVLARAEAEVAHAVGRARAARASWSQIGDALDVSRQGAQQRWGISTPTATLTGAPVPTSVDTQRGHDTTVAR